MDNIETLESILKGSSPCVERECRSCGLIKPLEDFTLSGNGRGLCGRQHICKSCKSLKSRDRYTAATKERALHQRQCDPWRRAGELLSNARGRAKKYNLGDPTVTQEWIAERLRYGKCEVTGLPFSNVRRSPLAPSLDRKDRSHGYSPDNIQVVCWFYNRAKGTSSDRETRELLTAAARGLR